MKIVSWNVNGVRAAVRNGLLKWQEEYQPDVLCIQEIKAKPEQLEDSILNLKGYYSYWNPAQRKGYSGTATFTKIKPLEVKFNPLPTNCRDEGRIIETKFDDFILFNIYFPNGQKDEERLKFKLDFYDSFFEYADKLLKQGEKLVVCGDYNTAHKEIDLKNPKSNEKRSGFLPIEREYLDRMLEMGFVDTFRYLHKDEVKYTWWSYRFKAREKDVGWRIDYFMVSENLMDKVKDSKILNDVYGSDHCPIELILDI
jgi:exodeoxyribonuclease-3